VKSLARDDRTVALKDLRRIPSRCDKIEALDKSDSAELNATAINNTTCDELVRMIRVAGLPDQLCPNLEQASAVL